MTGFTKYVVRGVANPATINLIDKIDAHELRITKMIIPYTWYLIDTTNYTINFDQPGALAANIVVGNYFLAPAFATAVQTCLNSVGAGFAVTISPVNGLMTIAAAGAFNIHFELNTSLAEICGFAAVATGIVNTVTGTVPVRTADSYLVVRSPDLSAASELHTYLDDRRGDALGIIPVNAQPWGVVVYDPNESDPWLKISRGMQLQTITLELRNQFGVLIGTTRQWQVELQLA